MSEKGRIGLVLPATIWQAQARTGLRRLLFEKASVESLYTFENYRKWAFDIDSRFKFTALEFSRKKPEEGHSFPAAFMLRDTRVLEGKMQDRVLCSNRDFIGSISPESLALIDNRSDMEVRLIERLHKNFPALGSADSGWNVTYRTDLHMTNDAWLFKTREWMESRGLSLFGREKMRRGSGFRKSIRIPESLRCRIICRKAVNTGYPPMKNGIGHAGMGKSNGISKTKNGLFSTTRMTVEK